MIKKGIVFIILFIFILFNMSDVKATSTSNLYFVFDKSVYNTGEIVNININLDNFKELNEIKLQIKIKEEYFEPVMTDNKCFFFSSSSICENDVVNDYIDNSYLRLRLIKPDSLEEGYYSSYKNNICNLKLIVKKPIDDISKYFKMDNYFDMGFSLYLFDVNDSLLEYSTYYKEKIKIEWNKENYIVNVFDQAPIFKNDILILNRNENEYEYLMEKHLDTSLIGLKTIHIGVYDKSAADYIILSKAVSVVDQIPPVLDYDKKINLNDVDINLYNFLDIIKICDNYDNTCSTNITYYDKDINKIDNLKEFQIYLSNNQKAYLKFDVSDSSNNKSSTDIIEINVIDTIPPKIEVFDEIIIVDKEIDSFVLEDMIEVSDNYTKNLSLVFDFKEHNNLSYNEILEVLKKGQNVYFSYFTKDNSGNISEIVESVIKCIDTTKPVVILNNKNILDTEIDQFNFNSLYEVIDNFDIKCDIEITYFINDLNCSKSEFIDKIKRGYIGIIKYIAKDSFNNISDEVFQEIKLIDTLSPIIEIINIKNQEKYIKLDKIEYIVKDNFDGVTYVAYLDEEVYINQKIDIGEHTFKIIARDTFNNETINEVKFSVIEDNIIGCKDDVSCYVNNYLEVVIIVSSLLVFVVILIVIRIISFKRKNKSF